MIDIEINLIVLYVKDIEQSVEFYRKIGLQFIKHRHGNGPEHYTCEFGSIAFEIYPDKGSKTNVSSVRIGFQVSSIDKIVEELEETGIIISPPKDSPWGRRMVIQDTDGNRVELVEKVEAL